MEFNLQKVDSKHYNSMEDVEKIANELKGQYKKIYVICFPDEQQDIVEIF
jgi:hypothetical protein